MAFEMLKLLLPETQAFYVELQVTIQFLDDWLISQKKEKLAACPPRSGKLIYFDQNTNIA